MILTYICLNRIILGADTYDPFYKPFRLPQESVFANQVASDKVRHAIILTNHEASAYLSNARDLQLLREGKLLVVSNINHRVVDDKARVVDVYHVAIIERESFSGVQYIFEPRVETREGLVTNYHGELRFLLKPGKEIKVIPQRLLVVGNEKRVQTDKAHVLKSGLVVSFFATQVEPFDRELATNPNNYTGFLTVYSDESRLSYISKIENWLNLPNVRRYKDVSSKTRYADLVLNDNESNQLLETLIRLSHRKKYSFPFQFPQKSCCNTMNRIIFAQKFESIARQLDEIKNLGCQLFAQHIINSSSQGIFGNLWMLGFTRSKANQFKLLSNFPGVRQLVE